MRRSAIIGVLVFLFIIWLVLIAYLAGPGASPASGQAGVQPSVQPFGVGIRPVNESAPRLFGIEEVRLLTTEYPLEVFNESGQLEVFYIAGKGVNGSGSAETWMYGIRNATGSSFLVLDQQGWRIVSGKDTFPDSMIDFGSFSSIGTIFQDYNDLLVSPSITERQIEVYNNTFYISVKDGPVLNTYAFDAGTGALILPNEE